MIIPIELNFTADKDSKSALRTDKTIKSHDVNSVEFHITIEGLELSDNHTAKILSVFHSSKSQANVDCEIVDGKIIYKPDTNLISMYEHVTNYVYVYNDNQSLDVREFIYVVDLSKIDETSLEVKEVYDKSYADLLADFEQALEDYKLTLPQADSVRAEIDVVLNQFSVDSQAKLSQYDADAQQVIADNQTAFDLAESVRQEDFDTSQSEKQQQFDNAQTARQESYDQTQSLINEAEESRVQAEGQRESSESSRVSAESERVLAEDERENAEDSREQSEGERKANEEARELSEDERENAEAQRKIDHANRSSELAGKADKLLLKNLIINGDFRNGKDKWTLELATSDVVNGAIEVQVTQKFGSIRQDVLNGASKKGHIIYAIGELETTSDLVYMYINDGRSQTEISPTPGVRGVYSGIRTIREDATRLRISIQDNREYGWDKYKIYKVITLDLTDIFGAGNEPTKEEMDELIKVTGYIDGEYSLNNKEMLIWTLALIRRNKNAIVALGGA